MKKLFAILTVGLGILAVSCNKDQSAVKKLDGSWTATKYSETDGGVTYDYLSSGGTFKMTFDGCKLKADEWCVTSSTQVFGGFTFSSTDVYRVTGDGTVLESKDEKTSTTYSTITIVELSKSKCVLQDVDGSSTINIELSKD